MITDSWAVFAFGFIQSGLRANIGLYRDGFAPLQEAVIHIGAKTGGTVAMQFAADYPARTRTLTVVSGPASAPPTLAYADPAQIPQADRLGSAASKEMADYWANMFKTAPKIPTKGLRNAITGAP